MAQNIFFEISKKIPNYQSRVR